MKKNGFIYLLFFNFLIFGGSVWVFIAVHGLFSSCGAGRLLFIAVRGLLLLQSTGSRRAGSVVVARGL